MNHGSLFSGIGGFDLAAEWMGWNNIFQVENDSFCNKILAKNFPDTLRFGDIVEFNKMLKDGKITTDTRLQRQKVNEKQTEGVVKYNKRKYSIPRIDILTGGFPCQPFSHAGKRKGTDDSRYLWPEMLTTIRTLKPSFVVGENVAGLVSMEDGKTLERIFADLENEGYTVESFIIPACAVGAWHRRDRIWIVAYKSGKRLEGEFGAKLQRGRMRFADSNKDVPNAQSKQSTPTDEREYSQQEQIKSGGRSLQTRISEDAPNTISRGQQGQGQHEQPIGAEESENRQTDRTEPVCRPNIGGTQSCLGGVASRLPLELDGYWDREPEGTPRVVTGIKDRVNRLKGLGNAIVPQVAYEIFKAIEKI